MWIPLLCALALLAWTSQALAQERVIVDATPTGTISGFFLIASAILVGGPSF
ncbi:MAG: hypothetical protein H0W53_13010 [Acidobacteria bacterium]|nr:hypothetical protein [Acidobacteriota bacterium]